MDEYKRIRNVRQSRQSQCRKRGSEFSCGTELENALMLLAWEAGEISIGLVADALKIGYINARELRMRKIEEGKRLAAALTEPRRKRTIKQAERLREKLRALEEQAEEGR